MQKIESNTNFIDEEPSESNKIDIGCDVSKATCHEKNRTLCVSSKSKNIDHAQKVHAYHKLRLKHNIETGVANTDIDNQSNIAHDTNDSVEETTPSDINTSKIGLHHLNKKRCNKTFTKMHNKCKTTKTDMMPKHLVLKY